MRKLVFSYLFAWLLIWPSDIRFNLPPYIRYWTPHQKWTLSPLFIYFEFENECCLSGVCFITDNAMEIAYKYEYAAIKGISLRFHQLETNIALSLSLYFSSKWRSRLVSSCQCTSGISSLPIIRRKNFARSIPIEFRYA